MTGVYIIENRVNGNVYVGSACDFQHRRRLHVSDLNNGKHDNQHLQRAWDKYGASAFEFKVILYCGIRFLIQWEQIAINGLRDTVGWSRMYNMSPTAGSRLGVKASEETRKRMSVAVRGRKMSPEFRAKAAARWLGRKHSMESRLKMSAAQKGRIVSPELIAKLRAGNVGRKHSAETKAKMSLAQKGRKKSLEHIANAAAANRGRVHTAQSRANMSAAHRGKVLTPEHRAKLASSVRRFYELKRNQQMPDTATVKQVIAKQEKESQ